MFTVSSYIVHIWIFIYWHMYSDVQMSYRKSERSMQTSNNKISVSSKGSKCLGTVQLILVY